MAGEFRTEGAASRGSIADVRRYDLAAYVAVGQSIRTYFNLHGAVANS